MAGPDEHPIDAGEPPDGISAEACSAGADPDWTQRCVGCGRLLPLSDEGILRWWLLGAGP